MAGPSNPHKRLPTSDLAARGIAGAVDGDAGPDARRRRHHRRHHQLHQHQQPAQRDRRGPARAQRERARADAQAVGQVLARAGLEGGAAVPRRSRPAARAREAGLRHRRLRVHDVQRHVGRARSGDPAGESSSATCTRRPCSRATATSTAASIRTPSRPSSRRRRWSWPTRSPARCASTSRRTCSAIDADGQPVTLKDLWPSDAEIDAIVACSVKPEHFRQVYDPMFKHAGRQRRADQPAVRLASAEHLHPPSAVLGRRAGRRAHAARHAPAGGAAGQHHHRPPVAVQRDPARQRGRRVPARRWACPRRTSTPTPRIAATT